ncbi:MAG: hypothetical protein NNA19_13645 [Nitrospira sp.]|nr:hypothetical protein [Nitrospira sp.]MCP9476280.1 hypothetical protein [Nitrospira sp.]
MRKLVAILTVGCWLGLPWQAAFGNETGGSVAEVPAEDYPLYDRAIERLFLTSHTRLLLIERMTVTRLLPNQTEPMTVDRFYEQDYFTGRLSRELVHDFVHVNRTAARLEGRFHIGVPYRFLSNGLIEEPEVLSMRALKARRLAQMPMPPSDHLAFSKIGRILRNDQALLYVEQVRPDGTGAGFLVWFERKGPDWKILETDVVWTIRDENSEGEEFP